MYNFKKYTRGSIFISPTFKIKTDIGYVNFDLYDISFTIKESSYEYSPILLKYDKVNGGVILSADKYAFSLKQDVIDLPVGLYSYVIKIKYQTSTEENLIEGKFLIVD